ncbi:MAG: aldehyde dehydrogenase [Candidatus Hydrothermota bacterium]|nr:MAG: aldehyde dehydrogenase [Candidatus Hydrothermae bacterium]
MAKDYMNYIGGKWVESKSGRRFENRNPANWDELIGTFPKSTAEDVADAVEAAKKAFPKWKSIPAPKRGEILRRATELLVERKEELARLMTREMGKILKETRGDVQEGIDTGFYAFGEGRRLFSPNAPSELPDKLALTFRLPVGIAGLITPWNFPIAIPAWKIFPALLAGNTVVFKPATDTPACAAEFVKIFEEAGLPPGVLNLVTGSGSEVGEAILAHPDIRVISFTGSVETGSRIAEVAGKHLKKVSLELGGKNPQIVMPSADIDLAVEGALWGAFGTTGQRCTATSRIILHEDIYDEFMHKFIERTKNLKIGNGLDESVDMGPVINESQLKKIEMYVRIGVEEGASLTYGGHRLTDGELAKGWFFEPTIFEGVKPDMRIAQEEIFGPVVAVFKVKSLDEAFEIANGVKYGLSSSIYTRDLREAMRAIQELEAGITYVNAPTIGAECHMPFGGVKATGNGHREGGWTVYEIFTEWKTVYIDFSGKLQKAQIDTWTDLE